MSPALAEPGELPAARLPKQLRSAEVLHRVAAAGRDLLEARDADDVSVMDIAARAGVSVGAFYTRFPSKEHLVVHLVAQLAAEVRERMAKALDPARWRDASLRDVIDFYIREMAASFVRHRGLMRPASLIARQTRDRELTRLLSQFNADIHARFRALLLERRDEMTHAQPAVAVDLAILSMSAVMREVFLYGEPVSRLAPAHRQLIDELTVATLAYLGA